MELDYDDDEFEKKTDESKAEKSDEKIETDETKVRNIFFLFESRLYQVNFFLCTTFSKTLCLIRIDLDIFSGKIR